LKTGIAYFSKTGNTKVVAEYLAKELDAKLIRLEENKNYQGLGGFLLGGFRASTHKAAKLAPSIFEDIAGYDTVILATPVWAGQTTPVINALLKHMDFTGKQVYVITVQADPERRGHEGRERFYREAIEQKGGKLAACFSLAGASPGKLRPKSELVAQVEEQELVKKIKAS